MKNKKYFVLSAVLFAVFAIFTIMVAKFDVQNVGVAGTEIGFASINTSVFGMLGVSDFWYNVTEILGFGALGVAGFFAFIGLCELITRKSIKKVDKSLLILAGFYVAVVICYVLFEVVVVNFRPILVEGQIEASYPSSHTMLAICILSTAIMQFKSIFKKKPTVKKVLSIICGAMIPVIVVGRLLSGVHWFTDIVGAVLLSVALVSLYYATIKYFESK